MSHNNRSKSARSFSNNPTPAEIKAAREAAHMTKEQAARLLFRNIGWWDACEAGRKPMGPDSFMLFQLLTEQLSFERALDAARANLPNAPAMAGE